VGVEVREIEHNERRLAEILAEDYERQAAWLVGIANKQRATLGKQPLEIREVKHEESHGEPGVKAGRLPVHLGRTESLDRV
jgi:hypothetical protein